MTMKDAAGVETPMLDKQHEVMDSGEPEIIQRFIDWFFDETEYSIGAWDPGSGALDDEVFRPMYVRREDLMAEYFGIDLNEIEKERQALLLAIRQPQQSRTRSVAVWRTADPSRAARRDGVGGEGGRRKEGHMKRAWRWLNQPQWSNQMPGGIVLKCSACESKLYRRAWPKRWHDLMAFGGGVLVIGWAVPDELPLISALLLTFPMWFAWQIAEDRIYHTYWMRKHPQRCQGGGHLAPAPGGA